MMSSKSISREAPGNSTTRAEGSTREPVDSDPHALTHAIIANARADRAVGRRKRLNDSRRRRHSPLSAAWFVLAGRLTCEAYLLEPLRARAVKRVTPHSHDRQGARRAVHSTAAGRARRQRMLRGLVRCAFRLGASGFDGSI